MFIIIILKHSVILDLLIHIITLYIDLNLLSSFLANLDGIVYHFYCVLLLECIILI
jgi:hypothetical protein